MVRYAFCVILGVSVDFAVYSLLYVVFGVGLVVSNCVAFLFGMTTNVFLLRMYFTKAPKFSFWKDWVGSLFSNFVVYLSGLFLLLYLVERIGLYHYFAKIVALCFTFVVNYYCRVVFFSFCNKEGSMTSILSKEEKFHDSWACSLNANEIMVDEFFEACTSPENRFIMSKLGDIHGKRILELGCGAGEASVYLAKQGADVTATDLSQSMLDVVQELAAKHGVDVKTMKSRSDKIAAENESYDIVYAANLLHHVDITSTIIEAKRVLKHGGLFVSWDPLAHNPIINLYRTMATKVRTEDEHPLTVNDLRLLSMHFSEVETKATWFTTLWIFISFYLFERVNPNEERYWKKIIIEHKRLEKVYTILESVDNVLLKVFPFLKRYCWNVSVICRK